MKYRIKTTNRFDKQLKRCEKRGYDMHLIFNAMRLLAQNGSLPKEYLPHPLKGDREPQGRVPVPRPAKQQNNLSASLPWNGRWGFFISNFLINQKKQ